MDPQAQTQQKRPRVSEENRKRAVRACEGCRRVKEKCEGGVPCRRCLRYRRQCVFTDTDHKDKVRSPSASLPERAARPNRQDLIEAERVRYMEYILEYYVPNVSFDIQSLRRTAEELKSKHRPLEWNATSTRNEIDELEDLAIDDEDFTIKALPDNTTQYSGEFSYLNFSMKIRQKIDEWMKATSPEAPTEAEPFEERWRTTQLHSGSSPLSASITCLPPPYMANFLVQIFFKHAQTNNFYVEEDWLRDKLNTCYMNPSSLSSNDASSVCAILMVLAVGTQFAHMESATPTNRLGSDPAEAVDRYFSEDEVGLTFYQFALRLLPDIIATASVRSVQACLLIGTYLLPLDTSGLSYTYFGLALRLAIQNGMHRKYRGEGLSARIIEIRNRVFWTAYTIDKRISILHGRPASLSDTDVDASLPVEIPGLAMSTQFSNHANMVALITLTLKLAEIVREISRLRKCRGNQQQDCLERLLSMRKHLLDWWSTLPEETDCRDLNPAGPLFRSNVHLKLDYCLTRVFIGRPFLFSRLHPAANGLPVRAQSGLSKNKSALVADCVEAALEIIDLCRLLSDESGLARASFTEFSSCRAALLVILAQCLSKRTDRLRLALEQGMGLIKIMSMGVGSSRSAVSVIEALERAIRRLEEWSETQPQTNAGATESAYDRFKSWEMLWKTGPVSPGTIPFHEPITCAGTSVQPTPVTPSSATAGSGDNMGDMTGAHVSGPAFYGPQMPPLSYDHFVSNFPQELGEFTAIPCFDSDTHQAVATDMRNYIGAPDAKWMQL